VDVLPVRIQLFSVPPYAPPPSLDRPFRNVKPCRNVLNDEKVAQRCVPPPSTTVAPAPLTLRMVIVFEHVSGA
jgi:hypothetical protein